MQNYSRNVLRWIGQGLVIPEDCFVFVTGGAPVGGVCFCDDTGESRDILDYAISDAKAGDSAEALQRAVLMAAKEDTRSVTYNLYDDTEQYRDIQELFKLAGFTIAQKKSSYTYERAEPPKSIGELTFLNANELTFRSANELTFRSVMETGEDAFIGAVRDVTVGTLDKLMADEAARLGGDRAAREYVETLKEIDFDPDWWRLGYSDGRLVGLILPQKLGDAIGGINYVGVLPQFRGNGYGATLLAEGVRILHENGIRKIYADIDVHNFPLASALELVGFTYATEESVLIYERRSRC